MREREEEWRGWERNGGFELVCVGGLLLMAIHPRDVWRRTWERRKLENVCKYFQHETKSKRFSCFSEEIAKLGDFSRLELYATFDDVSEAFAIFIFHFLWGDFKQIYLAVSNNPMNPIDEFWNFRVEPGVTCGLLKMWVIQVEILNNLVFIKPAQPHP